jgi:Holliday junction resolvasome RuvABC ATP-dependent DNA helicase subunit
MIRVLIIAPPGAGKTSLALLIESWAITNQKRIQILEEGESFFKTEKDLDILVETLQSFR